MLTYGNTISMATKRGWCILEMMITHMIYKFLKRLVLMTIYANLQECINQSSAQPGHSGQQWKQSPFLYPSVLLMSTVPLLLLFDTNSFTFLSHSITCILASSKVSCLSVQLHLIPFISSDWSITCPSLQLICIYMLCNVL